MGGGGMRVMSVLILRESIPSMPLMLGRTGNLPDTVRLGGRGVSALISLLDIKISYSLRAVST